MQEVATSGLMFTKGAGGHEWHWRHLEVAFYCSSLHRLHFPSFPPPCSLCLSYFCLSLTMIMWSTVVPCCCLNPGCATRLISEFQWKMLLTAQHSAHPNCLRWRAMGNHRLLLSAHSKSLLPKNNSELELAFWVKGLILCQHLHIFTLHMF